MELAIPLVALGGMYVVSNQKKPVKAAHPNQNKDNITSVNRENFTGSINTTNVNNTEKILPNTNIPVRNYPNVNNKDLGDVPNQYINPGQSSDKHFNTNAYNNLADMHQKTNNITSINSLTGNVVNKNDFTHNNMVAFYRGNQDGIHDIEGNEIILDNQQGSGSQQIRKQEQAPLFKPEENMNWTHGTPSTADFLQSRMNPSTRINNVKPFKEEKVGPGLNLGYTNHGSGGFNSGMQARDNWKPKSVDELRTVTNPKSTFGLANHEGPAMAPIQNRGIMGKMEKHAPDTTFATGADRYFTNVGAEKRATTRSEHIERSVNRPVTNLEYYGNGQNTENKATYAKGEYEESTKQQLGETPFAVADAQGRYSAGPNSFNREGYNLLANNRNTTNTPEKLGIVGGAVKAVIAPLMDVLKPSRKENVIGNARPTGDVGTAVPAAHVYNPADRTRTTIREMTENSKGHQYVQGQRGDGYLVTRPNVGITQRQTTSSSHTGNANGSANSRVYDAEYNMRTNPSRETISKSRPNQGGTQIYNGSVNIHIDKRDCDRNNNRMWVSSARTTESLGPQNYPSSTPFQQLDPTMNSQRMNPDILKAFKNNPYTKSLNSVA